MSEHWPNPPNYWTNANMGNRPGTGGYYPPASPPGNEWPLAPHAAPYYAPYPPPAPSPHGQGQGSAVTAIVIAAVLILVCSPLSVLGIVFGALALGEKYDFEKYRRFTRYAWIANLIHLGSIAAFVLFWVAMVAYVATG